MYGSFPPNSTKLAKFCRHLAIIIREREAVGWGGSGGEEIDQLIDDNDTTINDNDDGSKER